MYISYDDVFVWYSYCNIRINSVSTGYQSITDTMCCKLLWATFMLQKLRQTNVSLGLYVDFTFWGIYWLSKKTPNLEGFN